MKAAPGRQQLLKLCLVLHRTQRELLESLTSAEYTEWLAYDAIDPYGNERGDLRAAIVASVMANVFSKRKFEVLDFMPRFGEEIAELPLLTGEVLETMFASWKTK